MLLVIDVGNTNITMGVYDKENLRANWRIATNKDKSSDEIGIMLLSFFDFDNIDHKKISSVIISSVVPPIMYSLKNAIKKYLKIEPLVVDSNVKSKLVLKSENKHELGADRIVNAIGAISIYKAPMIIVDFGTATTFCAINKDNEYLGGAIMPGIKISMSALVEKTAKLPRIEISKPQNVIGKNTVEGMKSGVYYGYVGSVDYIVTKMKEELNEPDALVIATGGLARMISQDSKTITNIDSLLTLKGLREIFVQGDYKNV